MKRILGLLFLPIILGCYQVREFPSRLPKEAYFRGVNLTSWQAGEFSTENSLLSLDQLKETNIDTVMVVPTWYMEKIDANEVFAHPAKSSTETDLITILGEAKKRGFYTALKPHVDILNGDWRGFIKPSNPDKWFMNYGYYLSRMAQIASDQGCSLLIIGTELKAISGQGYQEKWIQMIAELRNSFAGPMTYAANWDEYQDVSFWEKLDLLGVDAYFPLSDAINPSLKELIAGWTEYDGIVGKHYWLAELENWHRQYKKPIVFTEIGYTSWDYAARRPWEYSGERSYNGELQAKCYQALINASADKDWLIGIFWWNWEPKPVTDAQGYCTLPPQGKPAITVLKSW